MGYLAREDTSAAINPCFQLQGYIEGHEIISFFLIQKKKYKPAVIMVTSLSA